MRIYTAASGPTVPDGWIMAIWSPGGVVLFSNYVTFAGALVSTNYPDSYCPLGIWTITGKDNIDQYECHALEGAVTTEWVA